VWALVGLGLATVGVRFVFGLHEGGERGSGAGIVAALAIGGVVGYLKGNFVLSRTARRNRRRIEALAEPRVWQIFTGTFYLLILGMVGLGRGLRSLAAAGWLGGYTGVGGLYVGIGAALLFASRSYFSPWPPVLPTRIDASPPARAGKRGVLLVNLGSPSEPTTRAVRRYLRQFLSDPRVVEFNRAAWAFVLNVIILPRRAGRSAAAYRSIWTPEGSPLVVHGRRVRDALAARMGDERPVALAMRYGEPSLEAAMSELERAGCDELTVLPLFPQYSNTTTGSVVAEVARLAGKRRAQPNLSFVAPFYEHPGYIEALAQRVEASAPASFTLFSFHGLPQAYVEKGDPYLEQCGRTAWLLAERLGLARDEWELVFQSRFGDEPWLQPYLDETAPALASKHKRLRVVAPAFVADCLETLEEIGVELREDFERAGGEELVLVEGLNESPAWLDALEEILRAN